MLKQTYPYELPPLNYPYDALEPFMDAETLHYHHDKHFLAYINNLNKALEAYPALQRLTLTQLLSGKFKLPADKKTEILNQAGGVYNHALFFDNLQPPSGGPAVPQGELARLIDRSFGSFDAFKTQMNKQALAVFGSGWTVLAIDAADRLSIVSLKNQDTTVPMGLKPLLLVDVWEHAYYLKYKNLRADYVNNIWNILRFPK